MILRRFPRASLLLASCVLVLLVGEVAVRVVAKPSDRSWGTLMGYDLPPIRVVPSRDVEPGEAGSSRDEPYRDLVVDGKRISVGDLWGFQRDDAELGYVAREDAVSLNGWWQSNSLGAREREETPREVPEGVVRVLVFGDSYAQGSRVPQEEAWPEVLEARGDGLDVVNLGVDGYSMGQSFLRYRRVSERIEHDAVMLMFVPIRDLWRDVNVVRDLGEDWGLYTVLPRFVVEGDRLRLVPPLYDEPDDVFDANPDGLSDELAAHLRRYDRFFFESAHRVPPVVGRSALYRAMTGAWLQLRRKGVRDSDLEPESEAVRVTSAIFEAMAREVRADGKELSVVFLPSHRDLERLRSRRSYRRNWRAMVEAVRGAGTTCVDLADPLLELPEGTLDKGYDGSHFGPRAHRRIAELIAERWSPAASP